MKAGARLFQEGNDLWYLAGINYPRVVVDAAICERLEKNGIVLEAGDDESPVYERGWKRWYMLSNKAV